MNVLEHKILDLLKDSESDITTSDIASNSKIDRHTAAKHLEILKSKGLIECRTVGKSKMWKISKSPFLNALRNNDAVANNIKNILQHVDGHVNIKDKDKVIWSNSSENTDCCDIIGRKCKNCVVKKTFATGNSTSSNTTSTHMRGSKKFKIITQAIKDHNNNTIAVVEILRDNSNKK